MSKPISKQVLATWITVIGTQNPKTSSLQNVKKLKNFNWRNLLYSSLISPSLSRKSLAVQGIRNLVVHSFYCTKNCKRRILWSLLSILFYKMSWSELTFFSPGPAFQECTGSWHENVPALKVVSSDVWSTDGLTVLARIEIVAILVHYQTWPWPPWPSHFQRLWQSNGKEREKNQLAEVRTNCT